MFYYVSMFICLMNQKIADPAIVQLIRNSTISSVKLYYQSLQRGTVLHFDISGMI